MVSRSLCNLNPPYCKRLSVPVWAGYFSMILRTLSSWMLLCGAGLSFCLSACSSIDPVTPIPIEPDSSSHDFIWEEISIGDDHSWLLDVYALNDTDVWAVGMITTRDGMNKLVEHNAIHWDGRTWEIVDVPVWLPGTKYHVPGHLNSVFAFSHDNVWFGSGFPVRWDGKKFVNDSLLYGALPGGISRMWGSKPDDVYLVGPAGALAHYNGRDYRILNSGITYDFNDVWGHGDTALCVASTWLFDKSPSYVYRLVNGKAEQAYMKSLPRSMVSIWFCPGMRQLTCVGGWHLEWNGTQWVPSKEKSPLRFVEVGIRGNSPVDFFVVDQARGIAHYNGKSWSLHRVGEDGDCLFHAISCTKDQVWAVGTDARDRTLIVHGRRVK